MGEAAADIGTVGGLAAAMGECLGQATAKDNRRFVTTGFPAKPTRIVWNLVCMGYGPRDAMAIFFWLCRGLYMTRISDGFALQLEHDNVFVDFAKPSSVQQ